VVGKPRIYRINSRRRYRCVWCGQPAIYRRKNGSVTGDKQHDLCSDCFAKASARGERKAKKLLKGKPDS
jgi:hypothetical protein